MSDPPVTSPIATGGAGTFYEQRVGASLLAVLLVRGTPPFLERSALRRVSFQTRRLRYATDDILLVAEDVAGDRRAVVQCKRVLTVTRSDKEFVETIENAWTDFSNADLFTRNRDVLGLVVSRASAALLDGLFALFHTALGSSDASDLAHRLSLPNFVDQTAKKYRDVIVDIVTASLGQAPSDDDVFEFLRSWRFIPFDVGVPGSAVETLTQTMLAVANGGSEAARVAEETWRSLLDTAAQGMTGGGDYERTTLPANLLQLHRPAAFTRQEEALQQLSRLTAITRRTIVNTTAGVHVNRIALEQSAANLLEKNRIVLVTGEAGSGKSVVADKILSTAAKQGVAIALRAGLIGSVEASDQLLNELVPIQSPKLVLIESAERVLEKSEEERLALSSLIGFVKANDDWRLVITCRDRYLQAITSAFLDGVGLPAAVLPVSNFDDQELATIAERVPALLRPLADNRARRLLRNPFVLSKAAQLDWSEGADIPTENRGFRAKLWKELVRKEIEGANGMPSKRDATFVSVCVRRARALAPFTTTTELDLDAAALLKRDDLLREAPTDSEMVAPSHDLLEDWGLLHWLSRTYVDARSDWRQFFERIGLHPAIRRVFRMWVSEEAGAGSLPLSNLLALITDAAHAAHWRDDALAGVLSSPAAAAFLAAAQQQFQSDRTLLARAIHITRVVCKEPSPIFRHDPTRAIHVLQPAGPAWAAVADALRAASLGPSGYLIELGFVTDWLRSLSREVPEPPGAESVAVIAERLLDFAEAQDPSGRADAHLVIKNLCGLPRLTRARLERLVEALVLESDWPHAGVLKAFAEVATDISDGHWLALGTPDLAIRVAEHLFNVAGERDADDRHNMGFRRLELEDAFALGGVGFMKGFPPSAYQGPFFNLLRHGGTEGLAFVLRFIERCCTAYLAVAEEAFSAELFDFRLQFAEDDVVVQRGDIRLWMQYRSFIPGHYMVQSALMALERWILLGVTEEQLLHILRSSTTFATTAVVASIVESDPTAFSKVALALLRVRQFVAWDHDRFVRDSVDYEGMLTQMLGASDNPMLRQERDEARTQEHRRVSLADVARMLQGGPLCGEVQQIVQSLAAELPTDAAQRTDEQDRELGRLLRMDLRQFDPVRQLDDGSTILEARSLPPELEEKFAAKRAKAEQRQAILRVDRWASTAWADARQGEGWRTQLDAVMGAVSSTPDLAEGLEDSAPAWVSAFSEVRNALYVAAVCVRDHWGECAVADREWCSTLITHVLGTRLRSGEHPFARDEEAIKAACFVCPRLIAEPVNEQLSGQLMPVIAGLVVELQTTANLSTCAGVHRFMWETRRGFVFACANAILAVSDGERAAHIAHRRTIEFDDREALEAALAALRTDITERLVNGKMSDEQPDVAAVDYRTWANRPALEPIAQLLASSADEPTPSFYAHLAALIARSWALGRRRRTSADDEATFQDTYALTEMLAAYVVQQSSEVALRVAEPLVASIARHQSEVAIFLDQLTKYEDAFQNGRSFWPVWQLIADATVRAAQETHGFFEDALIRALFLNASWKETTRSWRPLSGNHDRLLRLLHALPLMPNTLGAFCWFLYKLGGAALPDALIDVDRRTHDAPGLLATPLAQSSLEAVLARLIYGGTLSIRRRQDLTPSILRLLDRMIDAGSSAAFRLRDEFLTPLQDESPPTATREGTANGGA